MSALPLPADPAAEVPTLKLPRPGRFGPRLRGIARAVLFAAASLAAIGLLWLLYEKTQSADIAAATAAEDALRQMHQHDTDWNVAVMGAKVGIHESYDPLVAPRREIARTLAALQASGLARDAAVAARLQQAREAFEQKAELVESFKSHNSILRNSLRYLPTAGEAAQAAAVAARQPELAQQVTRTLQEALRFAAVPEPGQQERLAAELQALEAAVQAGGEAAEPARLFHSHAATVLRRLGAEAGLLSAVMAVPMVAAIEQTALAYADMHARQAAQAESWRKALVGYSAALLALVAFTAWRLRQSYAQIRRMNDALVAANTTLEDRVRERTVELRRTMEALQESERQLVQSEKLSSMGQMVAGIVHEINTPLAYVRSSVETVRDELEPVEQLVEHSQRLVDAMSAAEPDPAALEQSFAEVAALTASLAGHRIVPELRKLAGESLYGLDQIGEIVTNLKNFSRLDRSRTTRFDLREGLESTLVIARHALKGHAIVRDFGAIPPILCAPSQLNQVFLNLLTNAAQALPASGGEIRIATALEQDRVRVEIADNGSGIAPEHLRRIFDPFFTTKPVGQGTGLGLSIAYKIVQEHGGSIEVASTPGAGTRFVIRLPLAPAAAAEAVAA